MENLVFFEAKNGTLCCKKNEIALHSPYNPEKEAERFVSTIKCDFSPSFIVITGACLSYCVPFLRNKFPKAKIISIQYSFDFVKTNDLFDKNFVVDNFNSIWSDLLSYIGEEDSNFTLFLSWKPSENAYIEEFKHTWNEIKQFIVTSKNVLATRIFFNKRWLKNTLKFFLYSKNISFEVLKKMQNKAILLVASGPSLQKMIPIIKQQRKNLFILAVSSSVTPLLTHKIKPDACISTDGGFWAKEHLKKLQNESIPLLISPESAISCNLLENNSIIPLFYGDGIESVFFDLTKIPYIKAERNGTVSGTAAKLLQELTNKKVFAAGLDLIENKNFQHTQPNELELNKNVTDFRFSTLEQRNALASLKNESLAIYKEWFSSQKDSFCNRFFRVYHQNEEAKNTLGKIKNISSNDFCQFIEDEKNNSNAQINSTCILENKNRAKIIKEYLKNVKNRILQAEKNQINIDLLDPELTLWLKNLSLNEFLITKKNSKFITVELKEKSIQFLEELLGIIEKYDGTK